MSPCLRALPPSLYGGGGALASRAHHVNLYYAFGLGLDHSGYLSDPIEMVLASQLGRETGKGTAHAYMHTRVFYYSLMCEYLTRCEKVLVC